MKAILHGTWVSAPDDKTEAAFVVWAERAAQSSAPSAQRARVQRHPAAATTIEIAELLKLHAPRTDWRKAQRVTAVAYLPTQNDTPILPGWLRPGLEGEPDGEGAPELRPWRIEGLGMPLSMCLELLIVLPVQNHQVLASHRVGADLRYWGVAAKFGLELLARQRYLPGLRSNDEAARAVWLPVLDHPEDETRFEALVRAMPPACRAILREVGNVSLADVPQARLVLQGFLDHLVDGAIRQWAAEAKAEPLRGAPAKRSESSDVARAWWEALRAPAAQLKLPVGRQNAVQRFYQAWRNWTFRAQPKSGASFRICFRLEPPELENAAAGASLHWTLRYFLQASDDPSLLVPAWEVWREHGDVLSYLNRRFDNPQEKLLEGLGLAADLCPAIRRSLKSDSPESTTLTDQEAFTFLRETARLLEGSGFGVMVPPWWNRQDARLRLKARLGMSSDVEGSGLLNMGSLIQYDWELSLGNETLSHEEFERLAALKTPLVQVRGRWVLLHPDQIEAALAFWQRQRDRSELALGEALNLALGAETEVDGLEIAEVELDDALSQLVGALTQQESLATNEAPTTFVGQLRPYQVFGFSWLAFLRRWGFGACLADDMGLGKTIQAIALILHEQEKNDSTAPSLIICPTSLVGNWQREVNRFAPSLRVLVHHGSGRAEGEAFIEQASQHNVIISTYGLMRRDIEVLRQMPWAHVILDEAQNIKNPLTKQARAVRRLHGESRIALTGTPVENRLSELWSIMSFLNPGYLGTQAGFRRSFALPIERYQDAETAERLRKLVRPFILRRVKTDPRVIRDLPDKFEQKVYCNLTREQATLYEAIVRGGMELLQQDDGDGDPMARRGQVLAMLTRLKQVCNHPALYLGDGSQTASRSGKLNRLGEMLEEILEVGERTLIFTQFAQMGHLLQQHLQETFGQEVLFLHGGTPQKTRDRMIKSFQEDEHAPSIFVLSLKAGGTGLNLMRANHVFHYDRWWNPAVENQATDRAYRIGQTRDVQVHKFLCLGTLEERIDLLIESKRELAENVIGDGTDALTELSTSELRDLVALRAEAVETE